MVEQFILGAERFRSMSRPAFLAAYGEIFRALSALPGPSEENATRIFDLHQRYGRSIIDVVDLGLKEHAGFGQAQSIAAPSLVAMINSPLGAAPTFKDPTEIELPASQQAAQDTRPTKSRRFVVSVDRENRRVLFADGPELTRALNERKIPTARGLQWHVSTVANLLERAQRFEELR